MQIRLSWRTITTRAGLSAGTTYGLPTGLTAPIASQSITTGQTLWQWGLDRIGGYDVDCDICFTDYGKKPVEKTIDQLADEVLAGKVG